MKAQTTIEGIPEAPTPEDLHKDLIKILQLAIMNEENKISADNPAYASQYESYAVTLAEVENAADVLRGLPKTIAEYWAAVKTGDASTISMKLMVLEEQTRHIAQVCIKIAAISRKALNTLQKEEEKKSDVHVQEEE